MNLIEQYNQLTVEQQVAFGRSIIAFALLMEQPVKAVPAMKITVPAKLFAETCAMLLSASESIKFIPKSC